MNRTVNAAAAKQRGIRGIHIRVDLLACDVAQRHCNAAFQESL